MNRICRDYRVFLTVACGKAGYAKVFGKLLYLLSMLAVTLRRPYRLLSSFNLIDTGSYKHWSFMHWSQVWLKKKKFTPANTAHAQTAFNSLQASWSGPSMVLSVGINRVCPVLLSSWWVMQPSHSDWAYYYGLRTRVPGARRDCAISCARAARPGPRRAPHACSSSWSLI